MKTLRTKLRKVDFSRYQVRQFNSKGARLNADYKDSRMMSAVGSVEFAAKEIDYWNTQGIKPIQLFIVDTKNTPFEFD